MIHRFGMHAANEADLVRDAADVGKHFAERYSCLTIFFERLDRRLTRPLPVSAGHRRQTRRATNSVGDILALHFLHHRLFVEQIDVRRTATLPHHDDSLRLGKVMRNPRDPFFCSLGSGTVHQ